MMSRKGMAESALVGIVLTLVVGGVLTIAVANYMGGQACASSVQRCRHSLQIFKTMKETPFVSIPPRVDCPITPPCSFVKGLEGNKQQVLRGIAEHLRVCWDKTLGKDNTVGLDFKPLFKSVPLTPELNVGYCLACSEFSVPFLIKKDELVDFLKKETMSKSSKTYYDFLQTSWIDSEDHLETVVRSIPKKEKVPPHSAYHEYLAVIPELKPVKEYVVVSVNFEDGTYNHVFIAQAEDLPRYECDQFHYQKE